MRTFEIKVAAIGLMLVDHVGEFFLPQLWWMRWFGRLAFPLFGWLIANGARHTHSEKKYLVRLLIFAIISQGPYLWARRMQVADFWGLNVLFTLALGLVAIWTMRSRMNVWGKLGLALVIGLAAFGLQVDYGITGVASIVASYVYFDRWPVLIGVQMIIFAAQFFLVGIWNWVMPVELKIGISGYNELLAPLAFLLVYFYNGKLGPKAKYLFYVVYPIQFVVIGLFKMFGVS